MALHDGIEDGSAPSLLPPESNGSSVGDSSTATAATAASLASSTSPSGEESNKEHDCLEKENDRNMSQDSPEFAGATSPNPRPRSARRLSTSENSSDSDEPLEDRILRAPKQRQSMVRYTRLMEDRVKVLETKVRSLEGGKEPSQSSSGHNTVAKKEPLENFRPLNSINRVSETDFKKKDPPRPHLIDVWIRDNMDTVLDRDRESDASSTQKSAGRLVDTMASTTPERIRINCNRLLYELDNVTGEETYHEFLPPFTFFTIFEQKIKDHVAVLEERSRGEDLASISGNAAGETPGRVEAGQNQQPVQITRATLVHAETEESLGVGDKSQTDGKDVEAKDSAESAHGIDLEDEEEVDEEGLFAVHMLVIAEDCQVTRGKAAKTLKDCAGSVIRACAKLRKMMTEEELKVADAAKARFLLPSWTTLIALMDNDLRPKLKMCSEISNKTLREISYEDLGYLFKPGDVVLASQDRQLQALAVLAITGGRKLLPNAIKKGTSDEHSGSFFHTSGGYSPFVVDCYYYDFDGTNFGAILRSITIPKYQGKTPVDQLAVYPEWFSSGPSRDLRTILAARGRKFVQLCSLSAVAHRQYTGRTLDDPPEEVDSQVVIDGHMAAIVPSDQRPDKADWMPTLGMKEPTEPDMKEIEYSHINCESEDCGICHNPDPAKRWFFDHLEFDRRQSKAYVTSQEIGNRPFGEGELREHQLILLPYRVFGFVLRSRKWGKNFWNYRVIER